MNTKTLPAMLPAMAPHDVLGSWIADNETLLSSFLLTHASGLRGLFVSCDDDGRYRLRLCEGVDDGWMRWIDQRQVRSPFGRAYADGLATSWLTRLQDGGWKVDWSAYRDDAELPQAIAAA